MSKFMKSLCKIAIPVTLQSMLQASFSIVDQIMIGQLGETNISAVGLCGNFPLCLLAAYVFKWGIVGVYTLLTTEELFRLAISLIIFRRRKWIISLC